MNLRRTDPKPPSRRGGRVKAEAAAGGGATAPALMRPSRPRNNPTGSLRLTAKTVALPLRGRAGVGGSNGTPNPYSHPIHSHTPFPITNSKSAPVNHGSSSVNIVTHCR